MTISLQPSFDYPNIINLYPVLILCLEGQASQYMTSWSLHLGFTLGDVRLAYQIFHKCATDIHTRAVWKVRGLAAVPCCYAEGGSDCYAKLLWCG